MNKEKNISIKEIKARKKALEEEIQRIEKKYAEKSKRVKKCAKSAIKPVQRIKENPFTSVGLAVLAGFIVGLPGRRRKSSSDSSNKFSSMVATELKRLAARRTIDFVSEFVDNELIPRFQKKRTEKED